MEKPKNYLKQYKKLEKDNINVCKLYIAYELSSYSDEYATDDIVNLTYRLWIDFYETSIASIARAIVLFYEECKDEYKNNINNMEKTFHSDNRDDFLTRLDSYMEY